MPDIPEHSNEDTLEASAAEDDRYAELLLAGFRACAKEALRFLLEEEGLTPDHPLPAGLNEHLLRQQCHLVETLHNDSGVDLEESFMSFTTDGDTTVSDYDYNSEKSSDLAAGSAETVLPLQSCDSFNLSTDELNVSLEKK
ncbi:orange domain-containing protein [Caerostris extrusa]|uniref:Orange domain-containing protein n=1 Tax=Caerostris extrusa TaxID=172846 RepID=A0AAV4R7H9_CAEEX|nr:orange domain-containing protein [Caerostris extrusa]